MFLFVRKERALSEVPQALKDLFGKAELFTHMMLDENKKLARAEVDKVMSEIIDKGFYLQMPEPIAEYRQFLANKER